MLKATPAGHPLWVDTAENVSTRAAVSLVATLQARLAVSARAVIMLAADSALDDFYRLLAARFSRALDWRRVCVVQTDELLGLSPTDQRSRFARLQKLLLVHLEVGEILAFTGPRQANPALIDREIDELGGIDVAVHSLGDGGHLALNGPGSSFWGGARQVAAWQGCQASDEDLLLTPQMGVTVGLRTVAETAFNMVFAFGQSRSWAAAQAIYGPVVEGVPASLLQRLSNVHYYLDHDAFEDSAAAANNRGHLDLALEF